MRYQVFFQILLAAQLGWADPESPPNTTYWLYGSEDPDFEPNPTHLQCILDTQEVPLDLPLPFYRVVAHHDDEISPPSPLVATHAAIPNLTYPQLEISQWLEIAPYLLPHNHPVYPKLNDLFLRERFIASKDTLKAAGFTVRGPGSGQTLVARHTKLSHVLIKLFTDDQPIDELHELMNRIKGAQVARRVIADFHLEWLFNVPRKWLYIIPENPSSSGPYPKRFVLVVEDMEILPREENYAKWLSSSITKEKLDGIYIFLTKGGFNDLPLAFNIPFGRDGKLAVVDTEDYHKWPIPYDRLNKYLSPKMQEYWNQLIQQGGPPGFTASIPMKRFPFPPMRAEGPSF